MSRPAASRRQRPSSAPPRLELSVQYGVSATGLPVRSTLRRWARAALERDARVTVRWVGAAEGRRLNARYRGSDYATNVLTFVYDDIAPVAGPHKAPLSGDIVLCVPVVKREARAAGRSITSHCAHLVVHGMLHLQGYDHVRDADAMTMERREAMLLARLRHPDPYASA